MDPSGPPPPLCLTKRFFPCGVRVVAKATWRGVGRYFQGLLEGDLPSVVEGYYSRWYWMIFAAPFLLLAVAAARGALEKATLRKRAHLLLGILATCVIVPIVLSMGDVLLARIAKQGDLFGMLSGYFSQHELAFSPWILCVLTTSSWLLLPALTPPVSIQLGVASIAVGWLAFILTNFTPFNLTSHAETDEQWRIHWAELRAIEQLNAFVPPDEAVLIRAQHFTRVANILSSQSATSA